MSDPGDIAPVDVVFFFVIVVTPVGRSVAHIREEIYPEGSREILTRVWRDYRPKAMFVTENGAAFEDIPDAAGRVLDERRIAYLSGHLSAAADAIEAGAPLRGYFVWTLFDNFEWAHGTSKRFGLVYLDYSTQRHVIKASGEWYRSLLDAARAARMP